MSKRKILIVEDEREIAELIKDYLVDEGFEVACAADGAKGVLLFHQFKPDLVVLDIMLPKIEGTEIARIIRSESNIPIIMLSAKKTDFDKVIALGIGADDYMTKPFSPSELIARIKAQLRRYIHLSSQKSEKEIISFKDLIIHVKNYKVSYKDKVISFSAKEFDVLKLLAENPGQVFHRDEIFNLIWGYNYFGDVNTVTVHIKKIREKLEVDPNTPQYIKTVWGVGYMFEGEEQ